MGFYLVGLLLRCKERSKALRNEEAGISDLFGDVTSSNEKQINSISDSISNKERLAGEKKSWACF